MMLTAAAIGFFRRQGYQELSRAVLPAEIATHRQFAPNARGLRKRL